MTSNAPIKAPFPWFGGKSRVAHLVWERFGDPCNYVEPFAGSLAVPLARPTEPKTETVNDINCMVSNFWRAVTADPEAVAAHCDWPVNECDLEARHRWLVGQSEFRERMKTEPDFYDAKIAGWWVWGLCSWIGSGWCAERGHGHPSKQLPDLGDAGKGIHRKLPHLRDAGRGIHRKLPHLRNAGRGIHRKLPHLRNAGRGPLLDWFLALADRLRRVRVACGDWSRVLGPSVTEKHGTTAIFLDPPYAPEGRDKVYGEHDYPNVAADVATWAVANGGNPLLRIAYCGYGGTGIEFPRSWSRVQWKAHGGYGSLGTGRGRSNAVKETIWFSKHCLEPQQPDLVSMMQIEA